MVASNYAYLKFSAYENIMSNKYVLSLLIFAFLVSSFSAQAEEVRTSLIETIAGAGDSAIPGRKFSFGAAAGLASDASGNIYFTLQALDRVYRLGVDGLVTVYAGNGIRGECRNGVPAVASPLLNPSSLGIDSNGNLLIAASRALLRVDSASGILTTVLTTPYMEAGSSNSILGIEEFVAGPDALYIIDGADHRIKSYSYASGSITVLAGNGQVGATLVGVPATSSPLKYPQSLAVASDGTVYFSTLEPAVFYIRQDRTIEAIDIGVKKEARTLGEYDNPSHIALDDSGHLFVSQGNSFTNPSNIAYIQIRFHLCGDRQPKI